MKKQWADGPYPLIETPRHQILTKSQGLPSSSVEPIGTEMAQAHNLMIRGLNTMVAAAPLISLPKDISDFAEYAHSLCVTIHEHHSYEEIYFFPSIENATGVPGIMDKNVVQHEEFLPKLHDFEVMVRQIKVGVRKYDSARFLQALEAFAGLMVIHLTAEIETLMELDKYDVDWKAISKAGTDYAVANLDKYREIPFAFHNMDITSEDNLHRDIWPPIPWLVQILFRWLYVPRYKGAWRFGSCDVSGVPRELAFAPPKS